MPPLFFSDDPALQRRALALSRRLPNLLGDPIHLHRSPSLRDRQGPVHAASFVRQRRIAFDCAPAEFPRIFVHELFHFVWLRAGNPARWAYENLVLQERRVRARGELGWSAEWRKNALELRDVRIRTRSWREYCCESFCDTAAWLYSGLDGHSEFTLPARARALRRRWFERELARRPLSI